MNKFNKAVKEEISKELGSLILEVLHRLERENPELLKLLFQSLKDSKRGLNKIQKSEDREEKSRRE